MSITKETLDFMVENRIQNSRIWFQEHRQEYIEHVKAPLTELAERLEPCIRSIDPELITNPSRVVSRINRDTRFTKDKSLYRDVMWVAFTRDKKVHESPCGFVMEFSPMGFRYGCGYWQAPPKVMGALRKMILENDPVFRKAQQAYEVQQHFVLEGDCYKRSRYPEQPENMRLWLDRKNMDFMHNSKDFKLLFSEELAQVLAEGFQQLIPMYQMFIRAEQKAKKG